MGHANNGYGVVTGDGAGNLGDKVLPNVSVEEALQSTFKGNGCASCRISIYACANADQKTGHDTRMQIALQTGCTVCGTVKAICLSCPGPGSPGFPEPGDFDPNTPEPVPTTECVAPDEIERERKANQYPLLGPHIPPGMGWN
jgi:hypothetical protein